MLGREPESLRRVRAQGADLNGFLADALGELKPVQVPDVIEQLLQPVGLTHDDGGRLGALGRGPGAVVDQSEGESRYRAERCGDLMRQVSEESLLLGVRLLKLARHTVDRAAQVRELFGAGDSHARGEVAGGEPVRRLDRA